MVEATVVGVVLYGLGYWFMTIIGGDNPRDCNVAFVVLQGIPLIVPLVMGSFIVYLVIVKNWEWAGDIIDKWKERNEN